MDELAELRAKIQALPTHGAGGVTPGQEGLIFLICRTFGNIECDYYYNPATEVLFSQPHPREMPADLAGKFIAYFCHGTEGWQVPRNSPDLALVASFCKTGQLELF